MDSKPEKTAVILDESVVGSIIKDIFTFTLFAGLLYFNHRVLSGNGWIDAMFVIIVMLYMIGRNSKYVFRGTREDAIKWLQEK